VGQLSVQNFYLKIIYAEKSLKEDRHDPSEYITEVEGRIIRMTDDRNVIVGRIEAQIVHVDDAKSSGASLHEIFDSFDQTLLDTFEVLFDLETGYMRESLSLGGDGWLNGENLLHISKVEILPRYRGNGLGRIALRRMLKFLGDGLAAVVLEAHPVRYDSAITDWTRKMKIENFEGKTDEGIRKLQNYWAKFGFRQIDGGMFYIFDCAQRLPNLKEISASK
jgi:ribosomal protein S18 acetylase RimI-like enzyme